MDDNRSIDTYESGSTREESQFGLCPDRGIDESSSSMCRTDPLTQNSLHSSDSDVKWYNEEQEIGDRAAKLITGAVREHVSALLRSPDCDGARGKLLNDHLDAHEKAVAEQHIDVVKKVSTTLHGSSLCQSPLLATSINENVGKISDVPVLEPRYMCSDTYSMISFNVIVFAKSETRLCIAGNRDCLGNWDTGKAYKMERIILDRDSGRLIYDVEPVMFTAVINADDLQLDKSERLQFKYIIEEGDKFMWESDLPTDTGNRMLNYDAEVVHKDDNYHLGYDLTLSLLNIWENTLHIPPSHFLEATDVSEYVQTTTYFRSVVAKNDMDFHHVGSHVMLGSCPRKTEHFSKLKDLGVKYIINMQTEDDILKYGPCRDPDGTISKYQDMVESHGLSLIWLPTTDMCSRSKGGVVAQAAFVMLGVLTERRGKVYVHCNAGVGRSTAVVVAFLHCVLGWSMSMCHMHVVSKRPIVYVDLAAMHTGKRDFLLKYNKASTQLLGNMGYLQW